MKIAVYPGSFDPFTNGHLDVALRARKIFDKVIILVAYNSKKPSYLFSAEERVRMIKEAVKDYPDIEVASTEGLVVKKARELGAQALIRGLRAVTDYEAEFQLHEVNEFLAPDIEMVYLMSHRDQAFVSSSNIKEIFFEGEDVSKLVPVSVLDALRAKKKSQK
ncbi:MAG: pantetheine-phosphate adenylyltransferase [Bacilli bacterium]|jgi:pantetheine-phosphate adenylyltransferase|nr:pantetheine-phosphate adenylyltransferase [Bacilli bacterium]